MKTTVSDSVDEFAEFAAAVLEQLPRNLDPTIMRGWRENPKGLGVSLHLILSSPHVGIEFKILPTTVYYGPDILLLARGRGVSIDDPRINTVNFPAISDESHEGVVERTNILFGFGQKMRPEDAEVEIERRKLRSAQWQELLAIGGCRDPQLLGSAIVAGSARLRDQGNGRQSFLCMHILNGQKAILTLEPPSQLEAHYLFAAVRR